MIDAAEAAGTGLVSASLLYGMRHGMDVDHLAAIADITGVPARPRRALALASLYAVGHATVLTVLGAAAILMGSSLPTGMDAIMQRVVGMTLIVLGLYLAFQLIRRPESLHLQSRWGLATLLARRGMARLRRGRGVVVIEHEHEHDHVDGRHHHDHPPSFVSIESDAHRAVAVRTSHSHRHHHVGMLPADPFDRRAAGAMATGAVHGIGAETPTQILLFATAAGATSTLEGILVVGAFVTGLFLTNAVVAVACLAGFRSGRKVSSVHLALGLITATLSLTVGAFYLMGRGDLPARILGG